MKRRSGKFGVYSSAGLIGSHSEPYTETAGIVIGRKGTVGSVHLSKEPFWPIDTAFYVLDEPQKRDLLFTFYRLSTLGLSQMNSDSAVPGLNRENAHAIEFLVPPLAEQREIAATLGALDNKIELNRRMSATLEEMARSLYRSWFVDFDPVHAKLEGRQPAFMDEETAALFPDRFGEDGLPEGWTLGCLSDVAINPRTGVKPDQIDPSTPYIGLEHMPKRSVVLGEWGTAEDIGSQKSAVRQGDFLFGKLRPYFHKVGISPVDGICSTDIVVVRAKRPEWAGFVLSVISSDAFVEHTNAGSSGTRMPRTNWGDMGRFEVIQPSVEVAEAFEGLLGIVRKQIIAGVHETKTLATLRDSLLPKLMSGELRVGEAREQIKEHA
jgi:type I restriction enzyme S subunit